MPLSGGDNSNLLLEEKARSAQAGEGGSSLRTVSGALRRGQIDNRGRQVVGTVVFLGPMREGVNNIGASAPAGGGGGPVAGHARGPGVALRPVALHADLLSAA
jgi:hypothetical protein